MLKQALILLMLIYSIYTTELQIEGTDTNSLENYLREYDYFMSQNC